MKDYIIVGLGNPGEEYLNTRHNTGRIVLDYFANKNNFNEFEKDKKTNGFLTKGKIGKSSVVLVKPETFMNKSGDCVSGFIKSKKDALGLVVIHDDLDLPNGSFKISFNKGSAGHKGLESVIKKIKTKEFIRLRVGISPVTLSGKIKKPIGEQKILDFIIGKFSKKEDEVMKKILKKLSEALETIILEGKDKAMNKFN
ncbi:aminoacyl-tRNA hydrolase [Patescibacteria group bacterium]|nr:aminoacyl-tRNA hydrolase [Patescibacteria group bacterium]MBU4116084.1 aminoacyl-tRNA hydrolase [Patescibacteria group bacterium]